MKKIFNNKKESYIFLIIIALSIFFRFYQLGERFHFDWDQERDAQVVWQILKEGKLTLIGPRVVGPEAFFLGPLWFYLLVPFYFIFNMDPIAAAFFASSVGVITITALYFLTKSLFGVKEALMATFLLATLAERSSWNPILIPLLTIALLHSFFRIIDGKKTLIPLAFLLIGLGLQIHFQAIFFLPLLLVAIYFYSRTHKIPFKDIFFGKILFVLTFLPLILFDLRHNFVNFNAFLGFFTKSSLNSEHFSLIANIDKTLVKFFSSQTISEIHINQLPLGILTVSLSLMGILLSNISKNKKITLLLTIFIPVVGFIFYKGSLSEYYFAIASIPILMGLCAFWGRFAKSKLILALTLVVFLYLGIYRINSFISSSTALGLSDKKQAVLYIVNQKLDPIFNVSYSTKIGYDSGFRYLFKYYDREPQNIPQGHLWSIVIPPHSENVPPIAEYGGIGIIRR